MTYARSGWGMFALAASLLATTSCAVPAGFAPDADDPDGELPDAPASPAWERYAVSAPPMIVYINTRGDSLQISGFDDSSTNSSSIWDGAYPAMSPGQFGCADAAECEAQLLDLLMEVWFPWNIEFVFERPTTGFFEMVMVGGAVGGGVLGVANLDCGNQWGRNVSFVFSGMFGFACGMGAIRDTLSQELAHALGLCHNDVQGAIMFPSSAGCDTGAFICGNQVDTCGCVGAGYDPFCPLDYFDSILGLHGDAEPPTITLITPVDGDGVSPIFDVEVAVTDNRYAGVVRIELDGVAVGGERGSPPYTWRVEDIPPGPTTLTVVAADWIGNEATLTADIEILAPGAFCGAAQECGSASDCSTDLYCASRITCASRDGASLCAEPCDGDADCGEGFTCETSVTIDVCWPIDSGGCGCRTPIGNGESDGPGAGAVLLLLGLVGLALRRRR